MLLIRLPIRVRATTYCFAAFRRWFLTKPPRRPQTMHLIPYLVAALLPIASAADVCFYVAPSQALPNPRAALAVDTHATLTALSKDVRTAYLTTTNSFVFHNVTPGSYLVDFHSRSHGFSPLRLDLSVLDGGSGEEPLIKAWETFRGNDWDNKGEALQLTSRGFEARCLGHKNYFTERQKCELVPAGPTEFLGHELAMLTLSINKNSLGSFNPHKSYDTSRAG